MGLIAYLRGNGSPKEKGVVTGDLDHFPAVLRGDGISEEIRLVYSELKEKRIVTIGPIYRYAGDVDKYMAGTVARTSARVCSKIEPPEAYEELKNEIIGWGLEIKKSDKSNGCYPIIVSKSNYRIEDDDHVCELIKKATTEIEDMILNNEARRLSEARKSLGY